MNNLYTMSDCTTGFEFFLKGNDDPKQAAINLLKQIEEKEGCKGLNKYEMALTIARNTQRRMIGEDANTRRRLQMVAEAIVSEQTTEKTKKENLEFARKFKQDQSARSSIQPSTTMSEEEEREEKERIRQEKLRKSREAFANAVPEKKIQPKRRTFRSMFGFGGNKTRKSKKGMSLCVKKTAKKCTRVRGCKIASGKKRTYCRKKKNHTQKSHKK